MKRRTVLLSGIALVSIIAGLLAYQQPFDVTKQVQLSDEDTGSSGLVEEGITGQHRPEFALPDLSGRTRHISEWNGKVVTVNFWATWCPPCLHEIPELIALQDEYREQGLEVIGIALQRPEEVVDFAEELGINYTVLAGEMAVAAIAESYGNRIGALPYTAVFDRQGKIAFVKPGPVTGAEVEQVIAPLL